MKLFWKRVGKKETGSFEALPAAEYSHPKKKRAGAQITKKKFTPLTVLGLIAVLLMFLLVINRTRIANFVDGERCGEAIIVRYNNASGDSYTKELEEVAKDVESTAGYSRDITCNYIVYLHYANVRDVDKSRQLLETMKILKQQGKNIDAKILNQKSFEDMELFVKKLEHNRDIGDKSDGSG